MRQSIRQVEIDRGDAGPAQSPHRPFDLRIEFHPVDRALHQRVDILDAELARFNPRIRGGVDPLICRRARGSSSIASSNGAMKSKRWRRAPTIARRSSDASMFGVPPPKCAALACIPSGSAPLVMSISRTERANIVRDRRAAMRHACMAAAIPAQSDCSRMGHGRKATPPIGGPFPQARRDDPFPQLQA